MSTVFADTFYWAALLNPRDSLHNEAVAVGESLKGTPVVTTDEVLIEFLTFFAGSGPRVRRRAAAFVRSLFLDPQVDVKEQNRRSFLAGLERYEARLDKGYSLTDCISMNVMRTEGLTEVLTNDEHFAQEGYHALFRA